MGVLALMSMKRLIQQALRHRRSRYLGAGIAALVLACGSGVALAATSGGSGPTENDSTATTSPVSAPNSAQAAAFSVLNTTYTAADAIPTEDMVSFSSSSGVNVALARHAEGHTVNGSVSGNGWVVPGEGRMCLVFASSTNSAQRGAGCVSDVAAVSGELLLESQTAKAPGRTFVSGLVPNDVESVTFHFPSGTTLAVPVSDNVYMQEVEGWVTKVTFHGPSGGGSANSSQPPAMNRG